MLRVSLNRELVFLLRDRSIRVATVGYVCVYILLSLGLQHGSADLSATADPHLANQVFHSLLGVKWGLLVILSPWLVSRLLGRDQGNHLVRRAAHTFLKPSEIIMGKVVVANLYLSLLLFISLPVMMVAYMGAAVTARDIVWSYLDLFIFLVLVGLAAFSATLYVIDPLLALALSYLVLICLSGFRFYLISWWGPGTAMAGIAVLNLAVFLILLKESNRRFLYLHSLR